MWIILIDHSTSMGEGFQAASESFPGRSRTTGENTKLNAAKAELVSHLSGLKKPQRIALFEFTSTASLAFEGLSSQAESIQNTLDALQPADGTDIAAALNKAAEFVEASRPVDGLVQVLVITDGLSKPEPAREAAQRLWKLIDVLSVILIDPTPKGSDLALEISLESSVENVISARSLSVGTDRLFDRNAEIAKALDETRERYRTEASSVLSSTPVDERLTFTAAYPGRIQPENWYVLLLYLHLSRLRDQVRSVIERKVSQLDITPVISEAEGSTPLARGTMLTLEPRIDGVVFNPQSLEIAWYEDVQEVQFRLMAAAASMGRSLLGSVEVCADGLLIGQIPVSVIVLRSGEPEEYGHNETRTSRTFEKIFASYSHEDQKVVESCVAIYKALGIYVLWDKESLRSGDFWSLKLKKLITESDTFQLYWSTRASQSDNVRDEWSSALALVSEKGPDFIRPLYWEKPMPPPPSELKRLHFAHLDLTALGSVRRDRSKSARRARRTNFAVTVLPLLSAAGVEAEIREDVVSAVQFLEATTGLRYYTSPTLLVDDYMVKTVRAEATVDRVPEDLHSLRQCVVLASLLQSLALDFHVVFRKKPLPLDRNEALRLFGRGSEWGVKAFDLIRSDCEWIIGRMIGQALEPGWKERRASEAAGVSTFSNVALTILDRIASSSIQAPQRTYRTLDGAYAKALDQVSDLLAQAALTVTEDSIFGKKLDGSLRSLYEALRLVRDEFSTRLQKYDDRSVFPFLSRFGALERDEALARVAILICEKLGSTEEVDRIIGDIVAPLWRECRNRYVELKLPGISGDAGFVDFISTFLDHVQRLLFHGLKNIGEFDYEGEYGSSSEAWKLVTAGLSKLKVRAIPYEYSRSREPEVRLTGPFSEVCRVFAWANAELKAALQRVLPTGSPAQGAFVDARPTFGIYVGPDSPAADERIKKWALARNVPAEMTLARSSRVLLCLEAGDRFERRLRAGGEEQESASRLARKFQRSVLIHEHFHAILESSIENSTPTLGRGFRDAWHTAVPLNESLAVWMELHAAREDEDMRKLVESYIAAGPYPTWPYRGASAIEHLFQRNGLKAVRDLIKRIRADPEADTRCSREQDERRFVRTHQAERTQWPSAEANSCR